MQSLPRISIDLLLKDVADFIQSIPTPDGALYFDAASSPKSRHYTPFEFAEAFKESIQYQRILDKVNNSNSNAWKPSGKTRISMLLTSSQRSDIEAANERNGKKEVPKQFKVLHQNSFFRSMSLNFHRHLTLWKRDYGFIIGKMFENIGMAVATGGILFGQAQLKDYANMAPADRAEAEYRLMAGVYGALFMTTFHILLGADRMRAFIALCYAAVWSPTLTLLATITYLFSGTMTSAPDEIDGRSIHYKHADSNFYQTFAFVFGRLISTFPQRTIEIVSFGIPLYWMVGLSPTPQGFFIYLAILICYTIGLKLVSDC
jgi:ABC-2 type transporter